MFVCGPPNCSRRSRSPMISRIMKPDDIEMGLELGLRRGTCRPAQDTVLYTAPYVMNMGWSMGWWESWDYHLPRICSRTNGHLVTILCLQSRKFNECRGIWNKRQGGGAEEGGLRHKREHGPLLQGSRCKSKT